MPVSKERMVELQRQRRLQGRVCESCGRQPASTYHQPREDLRAWAVCGACLDTLRLMSTAGYQSVTHGDACLAMEDLAEDLKDVVRPIEAMRNQVRMYRTAATRRDDRTDRELAEAKRKFESETRDGLVALYREERDSAETRLREVDRLLSASRARVNTLERSLDNRAKKRAAKLEAEILGIEYKPDSPQAVEVAPL